MMLEVRLAASMRYMLVGFLGLLVVCSFMFMFDKGLGHLDLSTFVSGIESKLGISNLILGVAIIFGLLGFFSEPRR